MLYSIGAAYSCSARGHAHLPLLKHLRSELLLILLLRHLLLQLLLHRGRSVTMPFLVWTPTPSASLRMQHAVELKGAGVVRQLLLMLEERTARWRLLLLLLLH